MKKQISTLTFLLVVFVAFSQNYWTQRSDYGGNACYRIYATNIGDKAYCGMGSGSVSSTSEFWEYNPATNAWTQKTSFPGTARGATGANFSIGNYGYFGLGGYWTGAPGGYTCYSDLWRYDPATNSWVQMASFPGDVRYASASFVVEGKGYVCGGITPGGVLLNDLWEYNPTTNAWTQKYSLSTMGRANMACFTIGRKAYCGMGRTTGGTILSDLWEYDEALNTWTQKANCPVGRSYLSSFSLGDFGYVGCGMTGSGSSVTTTEFYRYDPNTNSWSAMPSLPGTARNTAGAFSCGGRGYIITGVDINDDFLDDLWEFTPEYFGIENADNSNFSIKWLSDSKLLVVEGSDISEVQIFDLAGRLIGSTTFDDVENCSIPLHSLQQGVYFVKVNAANVSVTEKILYY